MYKIITATILASLLTACNPGDSFTEADQAICINIRNVASTFLIIRGTDDEYDTSLSEMFELIKKSHDEQELVDSMTLNEKMELAIDAYTFDIVNNNPGTFANATYLKCYNELK